MGKVLMCHGKANGQGPLKEAEQKERYKKKCACKDFGSFHKIQKFP